MSERPTAMGSRKSDDPQPFCAGQGRVTARLPIGLSLGLTGLEELSPGM